MQRIIPYLSYADAPAAIDFLCKAFGFEERFRYPMPDGRVGHAELGYLDNVVMLASAYEGVDAHFARARKAGATIAAEPKNDHGTRFYRVIDPEGHRWIFSTPLGEAEA